MRPTDFLVLRACEEIQGTRVAAQVEVHLGLDSWVRRRSAWCADLYLDVECKVQERPYLDASQ